MSLESSLPLVESRELQRRIAASRDVPLGREVFTLPLLFITVAALGGVRVAADGTLAFAPPSVVALVLSVLLIAALVNSGALSPERLAGGARTGLENASGVVVLISLLLASAQILTLLTPPSGLLSFVFTSFLLLLLWNTLAVGPDRRQLLRSLSVVCGGCFLLKFVVLAAFYDPNGGLLRRVVIAVLEGVSLGSLGYVPDRPATAYLGFATLLIYFVGLVLLPGRQRSRNAS
jgi:hypothetical protein